MYSSHSVIITELCRLLSALRQVGFRSSAIVNEVSQLIDRMRILEFSQENTECELDMYDVIRPFCIVIASKNTNGSITAISLSSLSRLLQMGVFLLSTPDNPTERVHDIELLIQLLKTTCICTYENVDPSTDEPALLALFHLQLDILRQCDINKIPDIILWNVFSSCFKIKQDITVPNYSKILCVSTNHTLIELTEIVFKRFHNECEQNNIKKRFNINMTDYKTNACNGISVSLHLFHFLSCVVVTTLQKKNNNNQHNTEESHTGIKLTMPPIHRTLESEWAKVTQGLPSFTDLIKTTVHSYHNRTDELSMLLCDLFLTAIQTGGVYLRSFPPIIKQIQSVVFRFILYNGTNSTNPILYTCLLRLFYDVFIIFRQDCPLQIQTVFNTIYLAHIKSNATPMSSNTQYEQQQHLFDHKAASIYQLKEITLESLLDFIQIPNFLLEVFINYDCECEMSNLCEDLIQFLCKSVLLVNNVITGNHLLALKCLVACLQRMKHTKASKSSSSSTLLLQTPQQKRNNNHHHQQQNMIDFEQIKTNRVFKQTLNDFIIKCFNPKPESGLKLFATNMSLFQGLWNISQNKSIRNVSELEIAMTTKDREDLQLLCHFLRFCPIFNKKAIGLFISQHSPLYFFIRKHFAARFDFVNTKLDVALRIYLDAFRLPLEAQQIDRVLEAFSAQYFAQNPNMLANSDAVHTLAFSLIMLNTDAHNIMVKKKMTLKEFVRNTRGINNKKDVPLSILEELYHSIQTNEVKMQPQETTAELSEYSWADVLCKSSLCQSRKSYLLLSNYQLSSIDNNASGEMYADVFDMVWRQALATISIIFESLSSSFHFIPDKLLSIISKRVPVLQSKNPQNSSSSSKTNKLDSVVTLVSDGILTIASTAHSFGLYEVLDQIFMLLSNYSGININSSIPLYNNNMNMNNKMKRHWNLGLRNDSVNQFINNSKSQFSLFLIFTVSYLFKDSINRGWFDIISLYLHLFQMEILPLRSYVLRDFMTIDASHSRANLLYKESNCSTSNKSNPSKEELEKKKNDNNDNNSWGSYLFGGFFSNDDNVMKEDDLTLKNKHFIINKNNKSDCMFIASTLAHNIVNNYQFDFFYKPFESIDSLKYLLHVLITTSTSPFFQSVLSDDFLRKSPLVIRWTISKDESDHIPNDDISYIDIPPHVREFLACNELIIALILNNIVFIDDLLHEYMKYCSVVLLRILPNDFFDLSYANKNVTHEIKLSSFPVLCVESVMVSIISILSGCYGNNDLKSSSYSSSCLNVLFDLLLVCNIDKYIAPQVCHALCQFSLEKHDYITAHDWQKIVSMLCRCVASNIDECHDVTSACMQELFSRKNNFIIVFANMVEPLVELLSLLCMSRTKTSLRDINLFQLLFSQLCEFFNQVKSSSKECELLRLFINNESDKKESDKKYYQFNVLNNENNQNNILSTPCKQPSLTSNNSYCYFSIIFRSLVFPLFDGIAQLVLRVSGKTKPIDSAIEGKSLRNELLLLLTRLLSVDDLGKYVTCAVLHLMYPGNENRELHDYVLKQRGLIGWSATTVTSTDKMNNNINNDNNNNDNNNNDNNNNNNNNDNNNNNNDIDMAEFDEIYAILWHKCLDSIIFPLLQSLIDGKMDHNNNHNNQNNNNQNNNQNNHILSTRILAIKLLCKFFLRHLPQFIKARHSFHLVWVSVLNLFEAYSKRSTQVAGQEELGTVVFANCRNVLSIMLSIGMFQVDKNSYADELWSLTWLIVDSFAPTLKLEFMISETNDGDDIVIINEKRIEDIGKEKIAQESE